MKSSNKIAIVTGAGSGIGRAVALALLKDGYCVTLAGRRAELLNKVVSESTVSPYRTLVVSTDVSKPDSVHSMFAKTRETFGRLDLLFNNAGIFSPSVSIDEIKLEQWQSAVDINLTGAFLCAQEAIKIMKDQVPRGGRIINNGSIAAHAPRPNSAPYTATKHAITGLTKSISLDGRRHDIVCSQIDIGNAMTDMTKTMAEGIPQADGNIAVEPLMDLVHVVDAVLFMANLPLEANVQFMTILASKMPYIGRG